MKNILRLLGGLLILISIIVMPGCNAVENLSNSGTMLVLEALTAKDLDGKEGSTIAFTDVLTNGSIFNDNAEATFSAYTLDPLNVNNTFYQDVIVDQIDIEYSRTDGLSMEGKDVPYRFSQKVNVRVTVGETSKFGFIIIQHNAKLESPLVELVQLGQEHILKLEAKITFHGKDLAGNRVTPVVGSISVWCSNFADPEN